MPVCKQPAKAAYLPCGCRRAAKDAKVTAPLPGQALEGFTRMLAASSGDGTLLDHSLNAMTHNPALVCTAIGFLSLCRQDARRFKGYVCTGKALKFRD